MNSMTVRIISLLLALVCLGSAQSLGDVIGMAVSGSNSVKAAQANYEAMKQSALSASRNTLPDLSLDVSYRHVTDVPEINLPAMLPVATRTIRIGAYDTYEGGLTLGYLLFSGFAQEASVKMSRNQQALAENTWHKTEKDVAFQVVSMYRQIQTMELNNAILEAAVKRIDLQKRRVASLVENGMALPLDTLSLSLAKLRYEQNILSLRSMMSNTIDQLSEVVGQAVRVEPFRETVLQGSVSELALDRQEDLKALGIQQQLIVNQKQLALSGYYPKIYAMASVKYGKPGLDQIRNDWMTYGMVNVGLSWNLWSWGADKAAISAKEALYRESGYRLDSLKDRVRTRYDAVVRDLGTVKQQLEVAKTALQVAEEKMRIIRQQSEQGVVTTTEFNEANLELVQSEMEFRKQQVLVSQKMIEIDYLSGQPVSDWRF